MNTASVRRKRPLPLDRGLGAACPRQQGTPSSCCATSPEKKRKTTTSSPCKATIRKFSASILRPGLSPLYYNSEQVTISRPDAHRGIRPRSWQNCVHPESLKSVRTFYDVLKTSARLDLGEAPQLSLHKRRMPGKPLPGPRYHPPSRSSHRAYHALLPAERHHRTAQQRRPISTRLSAQLFEIYEVMLDTDSMRIVHRDRIPVGETELTHSYSRDTRTIANRYIPPR